MARHVVVLIVCAVIGISVGACDDPGRSRERHAFCSPTDRACVAITEEDFGADWPLSLPEGALSCRRGGAITFAVQEERLNLDATGEDAFGLNRAARDRGYAPPYEIWQWEGESPALDLRKSLKPILDRGLALCR